MEQLVFTTDACVGCNRCIGACSCKGANIAKKKNNENVIEVDADALRAAPVLMSVSTMPEGTQTIPNDFLQI